MRPVARKLLLLIALFFLFAFAANAGAEIKPEFKLSAGYRSDELKWNIAGDSSGCNEANDGCPNVLSELQWTDIRSFNVKASMNADIGKRIYTRAYADYGFIFAGDNQDSDYDGDDRTLEFSRSNNSSDSGDLYDLSAGIGYIIRPRRSYVALIPMAGYSYHKQDLTITDGFQTWPPYGPFDGLDSSYDARWNGPWAGIDFIFYRDKWTISTAFEYHVIDYYAEANWNLRDDFEHPKSYEHEADGDGFIASINADYKFNERTSAGFTIDYQDFHTEPGVDRTFFSDGTESETRLNEVVWYSYSLLLSLKYAF